MSTSRELCVHRTPLNELLPKNSEPIRLLVYSHDTFGLGNIRRMVAICEHLHNSIPGISILIITGSPMLHSFRLAEGLDYIKLPCLRRDVQGNLRAKYLGVGLDDMVALRRSLITTAIANFRPDVCLIDKKPGGLAGELEDGLKIIKGTLPHTAILLLLRDILDDSESTIDQWKRQSSYELIDEYFDRIVVAGLPEIFDVRDEYEFPPSLRTRVHFCGYIRTRRPAQSRHAVRKKLGVGAAEPLVVVTTGGGEDGFSIIRDYLLGLAGWGANSPRSLIVMGPDLPKPRQTQVRRLARCCRGVRVVEFMDDMVSCLGAADLVISMAGYNTVCEVLSLRKRAIIVPRVVPVQEQSIRAERMGRLSLFRVIRPDQLSPRVLIDAVKSELETVREAPEIPRIIDMDGLRRIARLIRGIAAETKAAKKSAAHLSCLEPDIRRAHAAVGQ